MGELSEAMMTTESQCWKTEADTLRRIVLDALAEFEVSGWQPVPPPEDGFYLAYEDGAMRTMFYDNGKWDHVAIPVMIGQFGDRLVSNEVEAAYGRKLEISDCIYEPTHWRHLPAAPDEVAVNHWTHRARKAFGIEEGTEQ